MVSGAKMPAEGTLLCPRPVGPIFMRNTQVTSSLRGGVTQIRAYTNHLTLKRTWLISALRHFYLGSCSERIGIEQLIDRHKILKSILWSVLENGSLTVVSFFSLIIFAKFLAPNDFGIYSVALAIVEVVGILSNMLFHDALIQRADASDAHFNSAFTVSILLSVVVCGALWMGFPALSPLVGDQRLGDVGRVMGLGLLVSGPVSILMARQMKEFGFRLLALRTLAGRISGAALGIIAVFLGYGLWSLVVQYLAMTILGAVTLMLLSPWRLRLTSDMRPARELFRFGITSVASQLVNFSTKRVYVVCVGIFLGLENAGYFNLAFRLIDTVWSVLSTAIMQVALPSMSRLQAEKVRLARAYMDSVTLSCTTLYPLFIGIGALAPEIVELCFGRKWLRSSELMFALSLLVITQASRLIIPPLLIATGRVVALGIINVSGFFYMIVAIALSRLSSPDIAVAVWMGCEVVYFVISLFMVSRSQVNITEHLGRMAMPLLASASMVVSIWLVRTVLPVDLALSLKAFALFLCGAATFIGFISVLDRAAVRAIVGLVKPVLNRPQEL